MPEDPVGSVKGDALFELVMRHAAAGMALVRPDGRFLSVNAALCRMLGRTESDLLQLRLGDVTHPDDLPVSLVLVQEVLENRRESFQLEKRYLHADGHLIWAHVSVACLRQPSAREPLFIVQISDGSAARAAQQALEKHEHRYRLLAENASDVVCLTGPDGGIDWISPSVRRYLGWLPEQLHRRSLADITVAEDQPVLAQLVLQAANGQSASADLRLCHAEGHHRWMGLTVRGAEGEGDTMGLVSCWRDIDATMQARTQLERALHSDPLTGLAGRMAMVARLEAALAEPRQIQGLLAVLSIGIDRLTQVNDALTHRGGDRLIATLAERLTEVLAQPEQLARGTADTFLVLLTGLSSEAEVVAIAERLRQACKGPVTYGDHTMQPTVSIGIVIADADHNAEELLRDASLAMRRAAAKGRDRVAFGEPCFSQEARGELALQARIREAIHTRAFQAWFMPVVDLLSGRMWGYEALVRWPRADGGLDLPDAFLPSARRAGLAVELDLQVLHQSIAALASLPDELSVAANVTPATLNHPGLVASVADWLERAGVRASRLHLEITETDLLTLAPSVKAAIEELAALGVRWVIDDFGTGFSSISHLRDLPVHAIKLDRSFTAAIGAGDQKSVRLAQALAGLAEGLGLDTVAEGVESAAEASFLLDLGWQLGQGWLYGKAAPLQPESCDRESLPGTEEAAPAWVASRRAGLSRRGWALAVTDNVPVGLFALRLTPLGSKDFLFVSRRWLQMLQLHREEVLADASLALSRVHPDDRSAFLQAWSESADRGDALAWEGRLLVEGLTSWVRIEGIPQPQADGSCVWQGVMSDISDRRQREDELFRILDHAPIAITVNALNDDDPAITYVNRQFQRNFGYAPEAIPRLSDWARLAYPDPGYRTEIMGRWSALLERARHDEGAVERLEALVVAADGTRRAVLFSAVLLESTLLVSMLDITDLRQAQRQLQQARSELAETALAITEAIPVGTYTMVQPPDGGMAAFSFMSERFLQICGLERQAAAADPLNAFACVHPDDHEAWLALNAQAFATKQPFYGETRVVADGEVRWISAESVPRALPDGSTVWEGVLIDITERIRTQKRLEQERARLRSILDDLPIAIITAPTLDGPELPYVNRLFVQTFGYTAEEVPSQDAWFERVYPDPELRRVARARWESALAEASRHSGHVEAAHYTLTCRDGSCKDVLISGLLLEDLVLVALTDVTPQMQATSLLAASEEKYRLLAENSSDVVMQLAPDGTLRWVSPSLTTMLGWSPEEWIGRPGTDFLAHQGDTNHYRANLERLQAGLTVVSRDRVLAKDGRWHWAETHASAFRNATGAIDGIVASFRTIDAEVEAEQALAQLAHTDDLTGLLNRREVLARLETRLQQRPRQGAQTAVLFCDIDAFKPINDRYGHAAGDQLLQALAERIRGSLRHGDLAARLGGDELLVVLQGVQTLENAVAIAEKIRRVAEQPVVTEAGPLQISLSIGVTLALPGESSDALIARADTAMYEAKQEGRNRVIPIQSPVLAEGG